MSSSTATAAAVTPGRAFSARFVAPLFLGSALNPINSSVLATALVPIGHALHVSVARTVVLVSVLYVASSIAQPTAGRLADHFGPRRVFAVGLAIVLVGGIVGGTGSALPALIVARILLGIGTSGGNPSSMVQMRRRASAAGLREPPGWVVAGLGGSAEFGLVLGLPLGAVLVTLAGWRAAFLLNVPLALVALAAALWSLPPDPPRDRLSARALLAELDVVGAGAFGAATVALLVFLLALPTIEWPLLGLALVLGAALLVWERRAPTPFLDVRMLAANRALSRTYLRTTIMLFATYVVLYGFTLWLETAGGYTTGQAGLLVLPMAAVGAAAAIPLGRRRLGMALLIAAPVSGLIGSLAMLVVSGSGSPLWVLLVTIAFGITEASAYVGCQRLIAALAPPTRTGTAMGLFGTAVYSGAIASSALTNVLFKHGVSDSGLREIAAVLIGCCLAVLALALRESGATLTRPG
jgi:MFS family permease